MKVAVGGTFNVLHRGHRALLDAAFLRGDRVMVGITSEEFARAKKERLLPLHERKERLERYLSQRHQDWEIQVIDDAMGPTIQDEDIEVLIVTPGNYHVGERINRIRIENGMKPLELSLVAYVLAEDFLPISSSRILSGEIDEEGRLRRPLNVVVGSGNPVKREAVRSVMDELLDDYKLTSVVPDSQVGEQPFHDDVARGADRRALSALEGGDLGVGIEAGIFEREDGLYDVQYCVIVDKDGWKTVGHGSGFRYPPDVSKQLRSGRSVSQAFESLYNIRDIGKREGAIGFLTEGRLTRKELTEQAVLAAMVPRIRKELYREI